MQSISESAASISSSSAASSENQGDQQGSVTKPTETSTSRFDLGVNEGNGIKADAATPSPPSATSSGVRSSSAIVQFGPSNSAEFEPVTVTSLSVTPTATGIQYPGTQGGNRAMATGFNQVFKKLDVTSQCNPNDSNQATACVAGELAACQSDGTYVLKSCPNGQSCYALPKPSGATGVNVECAFPSDAAAQLSGESNAGVNAAAASKVTSIPQTTGQPVVGSSLGPSKLPETESVQIPVQRLSSSSEATVTPSSQTRENTATSSAANLQSISKLPETESVQIPVQRLSSSSQSLTTPLSQAQTHNSASNAPVSTSVEAKSTQSSLQGLQTSQTIANALSQQISPTAIAETQLSAPTQAASSKQSIPTLQSSPPAQVTQSSQQANSIPSGKESSSAPVQTQKASPAQSDAGAQSISTGSSATIADGGPLFSLPTTTQQAAEPPAQVTAQSELAQAMTKAAQSPSVLAQEQPAHSTETPLAPAPHIAQAPPEAPQATQNSAASTPTSSNDGGGVQIVPEGLASPPSPTAAPNTNAPAGTHEKLAVQNAAQNANQSGTPIYITVTVTSTTTAHDLSPTA